MEARVDLYADKFDRAINEQGHDVLWFEASWCPCAKSDYSQPNYNCTLCGGRGIIYSKHQHTKVLVTGMIGKQDQQQPIGLIEQGTAMMTTLSTIIMGYHDRIEFPDFSAKYSQLINFDQAGVSSELHKPVKSVKKLYSLGCPDGGWERWEHFDFEEETNTLTWMKIS